MAAGAADKRMLRKDRRYVNTSLAGGLSATTIAKGLGVTPRCVHLLLEETGRSFTHHLLEKRLEKAAALLRDPRWHRRKIAEIAAEAGFTDLSYFNRAFRRHFAATPSDVRAAARSSA
jgi:AraC-like DNA-binding protein